MQIRLHDRTRSQGFSLIETLLAIAITLVVLGIIYSAYLSLHTVTIGVDARERGSITAMNAINQISRDLMCGLVMDDDAASLLLETVTPTDSDAAFSLYTATPGNDPFAPLTWYTIERVSYYVDIESPKRILIRESSPVVGSNINTVATNILLEGVETFSLSVFDQGEWSTEWTSTPETPWPKAARVSLRINNQERLYETDVFLPAGNIVTSSIERASAISQ